MLTRLRNAFERDRRVLALPVPDEAIYRNAFLASTDRRGRETLQFRGRVWRVWCRDRRRAITYVY